jgi:hypothetical protein
VPDGFWHFSREILKPEWAVGALKRKVGMMESMKSKTSLELADEARRREVEHEILSYFLAVESYPARAAREPQVSFEAHCWSVYTELESGRAN